MKDQGSLPPAQLARAIIGFALYVLFVPSLLFIASGTLNWPMAWVYVALILASTLGSRLIALKNHPDMLRERARFTEVEGVKSWDRPLVAIIAIWGPMAMMVVAGLNHRFGWSALISPLGQLAAAIVVAISYGVGVWAMAVNRFFSAVARIQKERGQIVVRAGPYRYLRHPSYAGGLVALIAVPFMLDSLWALVPAIPLIIALIVRTALEDKMLLEDLDGYSAYAATTRFRLIPGVW